MKTNRLGGQKAPWSATKYRKWDCVQNQTRLSSSHLPCSAVGLLALHPQVTSPETGSWQHCEVILTVPIKAALHTTCHAASNQDPLDKACVRAANDSAVCEVLASSQAHQESAALLSRSTGREEKWFFTLVNVSHIQGCLEHPFEAYKPSPVS